MIDPKELPETPEPMTFFAVCETCAWTGPSRRSNLTSLADVDRHNLTADHAHAAVKAALEQEDATED